MRVVLIAIAALLVTSSVGVKPSDAQSKGPKPWCIENGAFGPGTLDCTYWTFKQCDDSRRGAGGVCVENPEILWARRGQPTSNPRDRRWRYDQGR
jgi:Protein of unknown function (DUF3551)